LCRRHSPTRPRSRALSGRRVKAPMAPGRDPEREGRVARLIDRYFALRGGPARSASAEPTKPLIAELHSNATNASPRRGD
jgi:hypothetical protein